jgi:signal transduction histidine kinase
MTSSSSDGDEGVPARILIVDDEEPQMRALRDTLRDEGYATEGFASAYDALAALRAGRFDLMLTDLMMPGLDGIALLRAALAVDADLSVVMMTGHGTIDSAVDAMKTGAVDYVLKPFNLTAIRPVLTRALALRRLRIANEALERSVRERTEALENANRELEAFAHSVSHDLQGPVRAIGGYSAMLRQELGRRVSEREAQLLDQIAAGGKHLAQLIEGLLRFSRAGRQSLLKARVDVAALVGEVLKLIGGQADLARVDVRVGELPAADADAALLKQVFANLLLNALKFSAHRADARVDVGALEQNGETVYFVRDNGAGFDMKHAGKLFGVFERLHAAAEFEGTGIGLSIVQRIVQRHGGRIWAEASVGAGATFFFTLAPRSPSA